MGAYDCYECSDGGLVEKKTYVPCPKCQPETDSRLWVLGCGLNETGREWMIKGVFDSHEKAIAAASVGDWVGPIALNERLKDEEEPWPEIHYVEFTSTQQTI